LPGEKGKNEVSQVGLNNIERRSRSYTPNTSRSEARIQRDAKSGLKFRENFQKQSREKTPSSHEASPSTRQKHEFSKSETSRQAYSRTQLDRKEQRGYSPKEQGVKSKSASNGEVKAAAARERVQSRSSKTDAGKDAEESARSKRLSSAGGEGMGAARGPLTSFAKSRGTMVPRTNPMRGK
jgi:hypothetical protein